MSLANLILMVWLPFFPSKPMAWSPFKCAIQFNLEGDCKANYVDLLTDGELKKMDPECCKNLHELNNLCVPGFLKFMSPMQLIKKTCKDNYNIG